MRNTYRFPGQPLKYPQTLSLLVLGTTKGALATAPQASKDQFATPGNFDEQVRKSMPTGRRIFRTKAKTESIAGSIFGAQRESMRSRYVAKSVGNQWLRHCGK